MDRSKLSLGRELARTRETSNAWRLLASPLSPFIISCLRQLFEAGRRTTVEDMEVLLAEMLESNQPEAHSDSSPIQRARRELRDWIKRGLLGERGGELFATDELQRVMAFVDGLDSRIMTSTASRLSVVQRQIADLALQLSPDAEKRAEALEKQIASLQQELERVRGGDFEVRSGSAAVESIRDVYDLATSLRADFRRVEDSFREEERALRESLIRDDQHRGVAIDKLLDSHDRLIETPEGEVFSLFHQQLSESGELGQMKRQLREIVKHDQTSAALNQKQSDELSELVSRLTYESRYVLAARSRSDRDVRSFIKSGIAAEHFTVGKILNDLFQVALDIPFDTAAIRRTETDLPLVGVALAMIPTPARLRVSNIMETGEVELDLSRQTANLADLDPEFWSSFNSLDRESLYEEVLEMLSKSEDGLSIGQLVEAVSPDHDFETVAYLLGIARELDLKLEDEDLEEFALVIEDEHWRYQIPKVELHHAAVRTISWESIQ